MSNIVITTRDGEVLQRERDLGGTTKDYRGIRCLPVIHRAEGPRGGEVVTRTRVWLNAAGRVVAAGHDKDDSWEHLARRSGRANYLRSLMLRIAIVGADERLAVAAGGAA